MYDVGQVLYVILKKRQKIVPVQVIEQIVRRTARGEKVQYLVRVPTRPDVVDLDTLGEQVFEDIGNVKNYLRKNIFTVIDEMADKAVSLAINTFGADKVSPPAPELSSEEEFNVLNDSPVSPQPEADVIKIQLDNGQVANVKMPDMSISTGGQKKR